jgi:D-sedoheptulose 7-phosphate isomerase
MATKTKTSKLLPAASSSAELFPGRDRFYKDQIQELRSVLQKTAASCKQPLFQAAEIMLASFRNRGKLLICGNGGSAADAQHLAAELVIRLSKKIERPGLPAVALNTDSSALTAGANDLGFARVFARQIEALGHPEDVLLVISTSGNSPNLVQALQMARAKRIKRIGLLGCGGGKCRNLVNTAIVVPSANVQRVQETQIMLGHMLIEMVETELYGGAQSGRKK